VRGFGFVAVLGVVLGLTAVVFSSWSVLQNGNALVMAASSITKDQGIASEKLDAAAKKLERLESDVKSADGRVASIESAWSAINVAKWMLSGLPNRSWHN
jgi:hypothetical protein